VAQETKNIINWGGGKVKGIKGGLNKEEDKKMDKE
jgi:hypothetical protein